MRCGRRRPIGWLLVSGWPRRAVLVWATISVLAIAGVEKIAFHTAHFATLVGDRLVGNSFPTGFTPPDIFPTDPMTHLTPAPFLSSPSLWIGLAIAAAFLVAAVLLRCHQGRI
jgi:ABC-2 type transport system permease protein